MRPKQDVAQKAAFDDFYRTARHNAVLAEPTTVIVHLATAMALGCYP